MSIRKQYGLYLAASFLVLAAQTPASAAALQPGEYACAGASGILIGMGFRLQANGSYTDLDRTTSGKVTYNGPNVSFVGGHLAGQVGSNIRGDSSFEMGSFNCSLNR
jgi:hypothetical protein